jgi:hypothetical protein
MEQAHGELVKGETVAREKDEGKKVKSQLRLRIRVKRQLPQILIT